MAFYIINFIMENFKEKKEKLKIKFSIHEDPNF